ncbi:MAG TPA: FtsX-like permease family protein, partial [Chryseolinea sp.]
YVSCSTVILGVVAGIYPAFYLTAVKAVNLMKGPSLEGTGSFSPRSLLMTLQFTLSIVLMICAIASVRQLNFLRHAKLGFSTEQLIQIETPDSFEQEYVLRETFKEELLQLSNVLGVTFSPGTPGGFIPIAPVDFRGEKRGLEFMLIDHDYFDVMNITIEKGQGFTAKKLSYFSGARPEKIDVVVNECLVRELDLTSPIGQSFYREDVNGRRHYMIVGVVKDFHFRSLHHKISPMMFIHTRPMNIASIKLNPTDVPSTLKSIEKTWKHVYGDKLFAYTFLDQTFDQQYKSDEQLATIIFWFTALTLVIACLGLFALSSFMITRRTKEIGIRKSMGASVKSIYSLLSWIFLRWIILAITLACPVAWSITHLWLSKFAYRIPLRYDIFIMAAGLAFVVALLTITWQALKAASANPIKSLRYE